MDFYSDKEAKELIIEYAKRCYDRGIVGGNEGNLSCRSGKDEIWITPTMESKGFLSEDMLIKCDLSGNVMESCGYKPSSEIRMHSVIYMENPDIVAVIHAHPTYATSYACSAVELDTRIHAEGVEVFKNGIPKADYAPIGSQGVADSVKPFVNGNICCLMANHGAVTWSEKSMKDAYFNMEMLENYCRLHYMVYSIGKPQRIPE